jgi:hypothetical protein
VYGPVVVVVVVVVDPVEVVVEVGVVEVGGVELGGDCPASPDPALRCVAPAALSADVANQKPENAARLISSTQAARACARLSSRRARRALSRNMYMLNVA